MLCTVVKYANGGMMMFDHVLSQEEMSLLRESLTQEYGTDDIQTADIPEEECKEFTRRLKAWLDPSEGVG